MKMNMLLNQMIGELGRNEYQRQALYEVVMYIRGRYYVIKNIDFDYYKYEWNITTMEMDSEYCNNHNYWDTIKLYKIISINNHYTGRFQNFLNKKVNFAYRGYGYICPISLKDLQIKSMRVDEMNSQIIYYFE